MRLILFVALAAIAAGCNTKRFVLKQLQKHPEWVKTDTATVYVRDTIKVKEYLHDTTVILNLSDSTDSITIENDTVFIQITRWKEKLRIQTKVKEKKVPYVKTVQKIVNHKVQVKAPFWKRAQEAIFFLICGGAMMWLAQFFLAMKRNNNA